MTYAQFTQIGDNELRLSLSTAIYRLMQRIEEYREFRRTVAALRDLSSAQLADLGLNRTEILRAASESVYGSRA